MKATIFEVSTTNPPQKRHSPEYIMGVGEVEVVL